MSDHPNRLKNFPSVILPLDILHNVGDTLRIIDKDYRVVWTNRENSGIQLVGRYCHEVYQGRSVPCPECPMRIALHSGKAYVMEKWFPSPDGSGQWEEIRIYPVHDEKGNILQAIKVGFDVTKRKQDIEKQRRYIETLEKTLEEMTQKSIEMPPDAGKIQFNLTRRELEVLRLMAQGLTNGEISKILSISPHTVKSHVIHIFNKLGTNDRTLAAVTAARLKLI